MEASNQGVVVALGPDPCMRIKYSFVIVKLYLTSKYSFFGREDSVFSGTCAAFV